MQRARGDERRRVRGDAADERCDGEEREPGGEQPARAEPVAERAGRQHQARERERVGVDDPLQARDARMQIDADARERDVDDRHVELRDHEARADGRHDPHERGAGKGGVGKVRVHARIVGRRGTATLRGLLKCRCGAHGRPRPFGGGLRGARYARVRKHGPNATGA
ncbi:hypothetical protein DO70_4434 [Burkholderia pseudomallei]|nr:hypothetical protein DO70_4434 [Burkholderia pseudomallei]